MKKRTLTEAQKKNISRRTLFISGVILLSAIITLVYYCVAYNGDFSLSIGSTLSLYSLVVFLLFVLYFCFKFSGRQTSGRDYLVVAVSVLTPLIISAAFVRYINYFILPLSLSSMLCATLLGKREGMYVCFIETLLTNLLVIVYNMAFESSISLFSATTIITVKFIASMLMLFFIKENYDRVKFIITGLCVGLVAGLFTFVISLLHLKFTPFDSMITGVWVLLAEVGGILVCLVLCPIMEWVFRLNTNMQLLSYISYDQPLLKELAEKAPGTFNHSIQVGNFAERCAYAIGENVNLAKAAGYYHDVGKLESPEFFTENQNGGYNPHDDLIFDTSVKIITRHTEVGYNMLVKKRFPKVVCDVAREHHGVSPLSYFYIKAQNITEGTVDSQAYRYPGPKPTTKISAIVMIADTVEAASRSMGTVNRENIDQFISNVIREKREDGEFDDCNITMKELTIIKETLIECIVGSSHSRISYPKKKKK